MNVDAVKTVIYLKTLQQPIYLRANLLCQATLLCTSSVIYGMKPGTWETFWQQMDMRSSVSLM